MSNLILVRHSLPEIISSLPAHQWHLSELGRARCSVLAGKLRGYSPEVIVSSVEPKAQETAQLVAEQFGLAFCTAEGLHEHERSQVQWGDKATFERKIAEFFEYPQRLVMGEETADQAYGRFANAVTAQIEKYPDNNIVIVAHGTVISLFVARAVGLEPFPFWKRLGLPAFVLFTLPVMKLEAIVERVED